MKDESVLHMEKIFHECKLPHHVATICKLKIKIGVNNVDENTQKVMTKIYMLDLLVICTKNNKWK